MLILQDLVGLHRTVQLQLLQRYWLGHRLNYHHIEWFALEVNRGHSVVFETAYKYCILDSLVDHDGYSTSAEAFLPSVLNIMVIELNSPIPVHFSSPIIECLRSLLPSPV